jgi:NAD(P)-dependent dehydrogenase (short-subunit alcohol dehydrogenase family)
VAKNPKEQTALITGASRGLGLALARGLAARGWNLILTARDPERLRTVRNELAAVTHVAALAGDVADPVHRNRLAVLARGHTGLDALINNASLLGPSPQPGLLDYPLDVLIEVYLANVVAPLGVIQAVRSDLKEGARIVNVTSDAGVTPYPGWGGYGSSKAALEQLSSVRPRTRTSGCTGWTRATCGPTCIRPPSPAKTSVTGRCRMHGSPDLSPC